MGNILEILAALSQILSNPEIDRYVKMSNEILIIGLAV